MRGVSVEEGKTNSERTPLGRARVRTTLLDPIDQGSFGSAGGTSIARAD